MFGLLRKFRECESGNFAPLAAVALIPLLIAGGGAMEVAETVRLKTRLVAAADAAVLAAFDHGSPNWRKTQRTAHSMFDANINNRKRFKKLNRRLKREIRDNNIVYTYKVRAELVSLMGGLNPFPPGEMHIESSASFTPRKDKRAKLIPNDSGTIRNGL